MQNRDVYGSLNLEHSTHRVSPIFGQGRLRWAAIALILAFLSIGLQAAATQGAASLARTQIVHLNTATVEELVKGLVGVGQRRAEAIVAYRQRVGDFRNDDELSQVRGIGPHVLSANKGRISYAPSARGAAADTRGAKRSADNKKQ